MIGDGLAVYASRVNEDVVGASAAVERTCDVVAVYAKTEEVKIAYAGTGVSHERNRTIGAS